MIAVRDRRDGSDRESWPETITSEPWLERHFSSRAKWRSSLSACCSVLENCLTPPTLSETRCYNSNPYQVFLII